MQSTDRIMMSDTLQGTVADIDVSHYKQNFIIAVISVDVGDGKVEPIVGSAVTYLMDEHHELEVKVELTDAFGLTEAWPNFKIAGYELQLGEQTVEVHGPFKASALRVLDVDPGQQMCVLALKLCRE